MNKKIIQKFGLFLFVLICVIVLAAATVTKSDKNNQVVTQKIKTNQHPGFIAMKNDLPDITWLPDQCSEKASSYLKEVVAKDYIQTWKWYNASLEHNDYRGLQEYFDKHMAQRILDKNEDGQRLISQADLNHTITLKHLSFDFSVLVMQDIVKLVVSASVGDEQYIQRVETYVCDVHMTLQDGRWKIFNWSFNPYLEEEAITKRNIPNLSSEITNIRGINYYPSSSPWLTFWPMYDPVVVDRDLKRIKKLGLNTVRVFLNTEQMGRGAINEESVSKFDNMLQLAEKNGLRLLPTLFDFPIGFDANTYPSYYRQLQFFLEKYKDNKTILAWNIKNEPDQDFKIHGEAKVLQWLHFILKEAKQLDPNHPITIGWAHPINGHHLADKVDFISIHHYRSKEHLVTAHEELSIFNKPIVIEEFGYSSATTIWSLFTHNDEKQTEVVMESIRYAEDNDIAWMLWTLYDFEEAPKEVFGWKPWIKAAQKGFGLISTDGRIKPLTKEIQKITASNFSKQQNKG